MRTRMGAALALVLAFGGGLAAAENPFVGTWKWNKAKSKIPPPETLKFEKTTSGAIRYSGGERSYTFKVDGKEYTTAFGNQAVWKQIDDSTWEETVKREGKLFDTETWKLSPDGKTMTVDMKATASNGEPAQSTEVYERISGDTGLLGEWRAKQPENMPTIIEIKPSGQDGVLVTMDTNSLICDAQFDGKDYPMTGSGVGPGLTCSLKRTGPLSIDAQSKAYGKPLAHQIYTVSQDGRTLTIAESDGVVHDAYDRQ